VPPRQPLSNATAELGARIRHHRQALGLSQEGSAEGSVLHWSYIGQVERGQRNLSLHNLLRIAEVLGVDPGDLVTGLQAPAAES
jgi:transcriptional regulator with XRE-family HTH domain